MNGMAQDRTLDVAIDRAVDTFEKALPKLSATEFGVDVAAYRDALTLQQFCSSYWGGTVDVALERRAEASGSCGRFAAFVRVPPENGTVRLIPGSHRNGIIPHVRQPGSNDLAGAPAGEQGVIVEAKAGDVVAFSSLTLHATGANRSAAPRRVYLAQYTPEAMLDPGTRHLRRNAIPVLRDGAHVTTG